MSNPAKRCTHTQLTKGCKSCNKLKATWDKKLEKDGVPDIEQADGNLIKWHSFMFGRHEAHLFNLPAREEYYRLARQFLWDFKWASALERTMWELHSEGVSIRDIAAKLTKDYKYTYKRKVHDRLKELAKEMLEKCRTWEA